tara:strand:- start:706 stop:915 length:210 start_codon:yes stop_codon:yes gene_type:complete
MTRKTWKKLIEDHKAERVALVQEVASSGTPLSEAARELQIPKQQLFAFAKKNNISFYKSTPKSDIEVIE